MFPENRNPAPDGSGDRAAISVSNELDTRCLAGFAPLRLPLTREQTYAETYPPIELDSF